MTIPTNELHLAEDFPAARIEEWRALVDKALKGADFEKRLVARTADGIKINPLYTRGDALQGTVNAVPGTQPFTRGTKAVRDGLGWDIRTFHIEADPKAANAAIMDDLEGGVTSIGLQVGGNGLPATKE
ncbi:MAG TPA: methylmalonyl-CoA mutase family protein, partial [Hyphomicrobium sp.]